MARKLTSLYRVELQSTVGVWLPLQLVILMGHGVVFAFLAGKVLLNITVLRFQEEVLPQTCSYMHPEHSIGDPNSLSDGRLKTERTDLSGQQAQNILKQIKSYTYERDDIGERRLGCIADEVESAIDQLAIDNVVSSKWHKDGQHKTLDYSRLVSLLIPALNTLAKQSII